MKNILFNKILIMTFLFVGFSVTAQVRVKTDKANNKKKVIIKKDRQIYNNKRGIKVKTNRNRVVVAKPKRPKVIIKRPNYSRPGYIWIQGYWKWSNFYGRYIWQRARWVRIKKNHYWVPGFWDVADGGYFWIEGYWKLEF